MRNRKIKALSLALIVIVIITIVLGALFYFKSVSLKTSEAEAEQLRATLAANKQTVYVAATPIVKGDRIITIEMADEMNTNDPANARDDVTAGAVINNQVTANVYKTEIYTSLSANAYITEDMIGRVAIVDIPEDQPITTNMVKELTISQDTREYEITSAALMVDQEENDYVDIRLVYPNGEDYTVLSKKQIKNLSLANSNFFTYMNEDEILRWESAVTDAFMISGTRIYTTRYVEDNLQNEAIPNYIVKSTTIDLMKSDPNIYAKASQTMNASARLSLENRLGLLTEDQLASVVAGWGLADTAKSSVLSENVDLHSAEIEALGVQKTEAEKAAQEAVDESNEEEKKSSEE